MRHSLRILSLATIGALLSCRASLPPANAPGASDAYRAELARSNKGERATAARQGLEKAEVDAAKRQHTVLAYRHFLSEFPTSQYSDEVRSRLEALRFAEADQAGTELALTGFLADEPNGPHAAEAWEKLARVKLAAALASGSEDSLRAWLAGFPRAAGRDTALAALDEAQFAGAVSNAEDPGEALRHYLAQRPDGRHRTEAQALLIQHDVDEAALLEDDGRLSLLARQGAEVAVTRAAEKLELRRAAARLDRDAVARLAHAGGATAADATALLPVLDNSAALKAAASDLFLPQPSDDELPADAAERAAQLRAWAVALDGRRLSALTAEIRSKRAFVAFEALGASEELIARLPIREVRARAAILADVLRPKAQAAALLVQLSVLEEAAGKPAAALADARAAVGRDATPAAALRAARLEATLGEPAVAMLAARALAARAEAMSELHLDSARGSAERPPDAAGLLELCASFRAAREAERLLQSKELAAEPGGKEAREQAQRVLGRVAGRLDEAERVAFSSRRWTSCAKREELVVEAGRAAVARRVEAARKLARAPSGAAALERARQRDPAVEVQQAIAAQAAPEAARAEARAVR